MSGDSMTVRLEATPGAAGLLGIFLAIEILHFGFPLGLVAVLLVALSLMAHEAGHAAVAWMTGTNVSAVGACWRGVYLRRSRASTAKSEAAISLAGPAVNLCLVIWALSIGGAMSGWLVLVNLTLAVANLAPVKGSDGSRALACLGGSK